MNTEKTSGTGCTVSTQSKWHGREAGRSRKAYGITMDNEQFLMLSNVYHNEEVNVTGRREGNERALYDHG